MRPTYGSEDFSKIDMTVGSCRPCEYDRPVPGVCPKCGRDDCMFRGSTFTCPSCGFMTWDHVGDGPDGRPIFNPISVADLNHRHRQEWQARDDAERAGRRSLIGKVMSGFIVLLLLAFVVCLIVIAAGMFSR